MSRRRIFITVAEVSGDRHAAEFIRALRQLDPEIEVEGVGGPRMAEAGANVIYESVGGAQMGLHGAFRAVEVLRLIRDTRRRYQTLGPPDLHVCIDSSAMNLPFAKMATSLGVPVLYYVAPQLWASREGRIRRMRRYVDRVACILPFEEDYFRKQGVDATYVGHPLFDQLPRERSMRASRFGEAGVPPTIGMIAGSRKHEVVANFPHLMEVAGRIAAEFANAKFLMPTTEEVHPIITQLLSERLLCGHPALPNGATVDHALDAFDAMIPRCDLCLCKSGTSTLHVAAYGVPMIVVYRMSRVAWNTIGRWIVKTQKIALVNILAGNVDLVPEFCPWYGSNEPVIATALDLLRHPAKLAEQRRRLDELVKKIHQPGASMNAAKIAMEMMAPALAKS